MIEPASAHDDEHRSVADRVERCLGRIAELNHELQALITVDADGARAAARRCDRLRAGGVPPGPLHGLPMVLKDNIDTAGLRTTSGSSFFADRVPRVDAPVVTRLRAAGAVILGKANLAEFALGGGMAINPHFGDARNPWDRARTPGGSSSGSAVAVAVGMAEAALGTDTGGSVRIPACFTGLVGLRPTYGRVPTDGVMPLSLRLDTVGPLAHRAVDVARILAAISGPIPASGRRGVPGLDGARLMADAGSTEPNLEGLRVGWSAPLADEVDPSVRATLDAALAVFLDLGARVEPVTLEDAEEVPWIAAVLRDRDVVTVHGERLRTFPERFGPYARQRLEAALAVEDREVARAEAARERWASRVDALFGQVDVLLTPMQPTPAPRLDEPELPAVVAAGVARALPGVGGLPAASVPCGFVDGLPVGMQLVGAPWNDELLLAVADAYQARTDWHRRRPPLAGC